MYNRYIPIQAHYEAVQPPRSGQQQASASAPRRQTGGLGSLLSGLKEGMGDGLDVIITLGLMLLFSLGER